MRCFHAAAFYRRLLPSRRVCPAATAPHFVEAEDLKLTLRSKQPTAPKSGRFHTFTRDETWAGNQTAVIVCDMWTCITA